MTRLFDGKRIAEITMTVWDGARYSADWSNDFFGTGLLPFDEETGAYKVSNVEYCIDEAINCIRRQGEYAADDEPVPGSTVIVDGEIVASIPLGTEENA